MLVVCEGTIKTKKMRYYLTNRVHYANRQEEETITTSVSHQLKKNHHHIDKQLLHILCFFEHQRPHCQVVLLGQDISTATTSSQGWCALIDQFIRRTTLMSCVTDVTKNKQCQHDNLHHYKFIVIVQIAEVPC